MKKVRLLAGIVGTLIIGIPLAYAAGLFPGLPIIGQAAYCVGYSIYSTGTTTPGTLPTPNACNTTTPAGPTSLTGQELIPADTGLSNQAPSTVSIPSVLFDGGSYFYLSGQTAVLGATAYVAPNYVTAYIIDPTTTITALTLTLPSSPLNGQQFHVTSSHTITTFYPLAAASQTLAPTIPTALTPSATASTGYTWMFDSTNSTWYRLQ